MLPSGLKSPESWATGFLGFAQGVEKGDTEVELNLQLGKSKPGGALSGFAKVSSMDGTKMKPRVPL